MCRGRCWRRKLPRNRVSSAGAREALGPMHEADAECSTASATRAASARATSDVWPPGSWSTTRRNISATVATMDRTVLIERRAQANAGNELMKYMKATSDEGRVMYR